MPKQHRKERGRYHEQAEFGCFAEILRPVFFERAQHVDLTADNQKKEVHCAWSAILALMRSFASGGNEASEALSACSGNWMQCREYNGAVLRNADTNNRSKNGSVS